MVSRPACICGKITFMEIKRIATIHTDLAGKFGLPRQGGLVPELTGRIVFGKEYRVPEALRGLEGWTHIWLIWGFSENEGAGWSPTVRPPRLGGNKRVGVFASRSPFRPNPIGLTLVRLIAIDSESEDGPALIVGGVDMKDGSPIYDIKPYNPEFECVPDAERSFLKTTDWKELTVSDPQDMLSLVPEDKRGALVSLLKLDPRPHYQDDPEREYAFEYAGLNVRFCVKDGTLTITDIVRP